MAGARHGDNITVVFKLGQGRVQGGRVFYGAVQGKTAGRCREHICGIVQNQSLAHGQVQFFVFGQKRHDQSKGGRQSGGLGRGLVGFSGGAAFAGGLLLDDPSRWAGTAFLYGTLPFDAGVDVSPGRLADAPVLVAHGDTDPMIPRDLLDRTWSYLHDESGAELTAYHDGGGHEISAGALAALQGWIEAQLP